MFRAASETLYDRLSRKLAATVEVAPARSECPRVVRVPDAHSVIGAHRDDNLLTGFAVDPFTAARGSLRRQVPWKDRRATLGGRGRRSFERAAKIIEKRLDADHPRRGRYLHNQGVVARLEGKLSEARALLGAALKLREKTLGDLTRR